MRGKRSEARRGARGEHSRTAAAASVTASCFFWVHARNPDEFVPSRRAAAGGIFYE